jgi:hypothetical protein
MKVNRFLALISLLAAAMIQGCAGRVCTSHVTNGAYSENCQRECLSHDKYYKCECETQCICGHPDR